ncbi:hypothetical protein K461DRAFT_310403 [Myriangium duriaei CBS 260.36]|uniref:Uncharacterized protein n=1 Tax=Myriangium duriaei CBS 260.36 TaxID=1168546 RepID=A0A9P4MN23_9PEZI|nr:hypothetical protein K461DRAFT_310403 [Myriangium duriaei CBS 260.36]
MSNSGYIELPAIPSNRQQSSRVEGRDDTIIGSSGHEAMQRHSLRRKDAPYGDDGSSELDQGLDKAANVSPAAAGIIAWWLPELVASLFSVISLGCIVAVLSVFDRRSATDVHLPRYLTLNGLIALIATINKACLTVPIYSAIMQEMWLHFAAEARSTSCKSRLRDIELYTEASRGTWGSLLLLFKARPFSTFIQQLIGFDFKSPSHTAGLPNILRTENFAGFSYRNGTRTTTSIPDLLADVYNGILSNDVQPPPVACPTGNCTWPLTPSLAICGACDKSNITVNLCKQANKVNSYSCTSSYTLPSGQTVDVNTTTDGRFLNSNWPYWKSIVTSNNSALGQIVRNRMDLVSFDLVASGWSAETITTMESFNCSLWFCVKVYNTSVRSAVQQQTVVSSFHELNPSSGHSNADESFPPLPTAYDPYNQTLFKPSPEFQGETRPVLNEVLSNSDLVFVPLKRQYTQGSNHSRWTDNVQPWIESFSNALTNHLRVANSSVPRPEYAGTAYELAIVVRWRWLIFPVALVLLSILFLALVMIRTSRADVATWKGSALTLLMLDVGKETRRAAHERIDERQGTLKAVGDRSVRFERGERDGVWKFKTC